MGLARARYGEPFLLVLDEPKSNLDHDCDEALTLAVKSVRAREPERLRNLAFTPASPRSAVASPAAVSHAPARKMTTAAPEISAGEEF